MSPDPDLFSEWVTWVTLLGVLALVYVWVCEQMRRR